MSELSNRDIIAQRLVSHIYAVLTVIMLNVKPLASNTVTS